MFLSKYTICVNDFPRKDEYLLYHTRTQGLVKINRALKAVIDNYFHPLYFSERNHFTEDLLQLKKMGFLVQSHEEDADKMRKFFHEIKYLHDVKCFPVTILTTAACNFRCSYCFEDATRSSETMDIETCDLVIDWMKRWLSHAPYQKIYVTFYGGEPLLNTDAIDYICEKMRPWCRKTEIDFAFMLQTNGYLLSTELVDRYMPLGLQHVQISVDGMKDDHDKNRKLANGQGTFNVIMDNIIDCVDKVDIGLSVSYEKDNVEHIERLLDYLEGLGILHKLGQFIFAPVQPSLGPEGKPQQIQRAECFCNYEDDCLISANKKIMQILKKKNLFMPRMLSAFACPLTRENGAVTIDAKGRLFRCNSMLGHPEFSIGDIRDKDFNRQQRYFRDLDVWEKCPIDCAYLPVCAGGCRMAAYMKDSLFTKPACKKEYLDRMAVEFIKEEYLRETLK